MESKPSFWSTLPGILTGVAAILTALTGAYSVMRDDLPWHRDPPPDVQPPPGQNGGEGGDPHADTPPGTPPDKQVDVPATDTNGDLVALKPLVDCSLAPYRLPNTLRSLMSWSDHYQAQIDAAAPGSPPTYACQQALSYRGSAHCQAPGDTAIRQALFETLSQCRSKGVDPEALARN